MKKSLKLLLLVTALVMAIVLPAQAANFENCADQLNALGLFKGTDKGYELDVAPTRAQALVMLTRLLGLETEALAGEYEHPFTDVPVWAEKYVGYSYENGLTKGVSETEFGTNNLCDAKMYSTFVLRALGYDDAKGDFAYADAVAFGKQTGIVDDLIADGDFLRDDMAAISYLSLNVQPKDKAHATLLDKLVAAGAVDAEAAKPVQEYFALYKEYTEASAKSATVANTEMSQKMNMTMKAGEESTTATTDGTYKIIIDGTKLQMQADMSMVIGEEKQDYSMYVKDGYCYMNVGEDKVKMPMDFEAALASMPTDAVTMEPIYMLEKLTKSTVDGNTVYTVTYRTDVFGGMVNSVLASTMQGIDAGTVTKLSINLLSCDVTIGTDGMLKSADVTMDMAMTVKSGESEVAVSVTADIEMTVVATGDKVTITFPSDLDTYKEQVTQ